MSLLVDKVKNEVMFEIENYKNSSEYNYDFWNEHIKYVYEEAVKLANKYSANIEIVELGALLHDIALIKKVGTKVDHHINGAKLGKEILEKYNCSQDIKEKVIGCIYNHRSSKNATNLEEQCVCDADILAHFDNITMMYSVAFKNPNTTLNDVREHMKKSFEKDFNDLSEETKKDFTERYNMINKVIFGI
jgi:uncharacterized protein